MKKKGKKGKEWKQVGCGRRHREQGKIIGRKTRTYVNSHQQKGMEIQRMWG
jgi:hypothetical protein